MRKKLFLWFGLLLISLGLALPLLKPTAIAASTNNDGVTDLKRRQLHTYADCLAQINTSGEISKPDGLFKNFNDRLNGDTGSYGSKQATVVGLDRDTTNGVVSCYSAIRDGEHALDNLTFTSDAIRNYMVEKLTGYCFSKCLYTSGKAVTGTTKIPLDKVQYHLSLLKNRVGQAESKFDPPSNYLIASRVLKMYSVCYNVTTKPPSGSYDGLTMDGGWLIKRGAHDTLAQAVAKGIITHTRTAHLTAHFDEYYVGDINLNYLASLPFESDASLDGGDDFYPMGDDSVASQGRFKNEFINCDYIKNHKKDVLKDVSISSTGAIVLKGSDGNPNITASGSGTNGTTIGELKCDVSINPLTWFVCPLVSLANTALQTFDSAISNRLCIDTSKVFNISGKSGATTGNCANSSSDPSAGADSSQAFYAAWNGFRIIAVSMLVLIGLVMVISQAFAIGPFDAYTVKKVLPRLLVAVIMISASWYAMQFLINMSNDLGVGVRAAIETPFSNLGNPHLNTSIISGGAVAGAVAFVALGPLGMLSFALIGLVAVIIAFAVIVIREMVILFLVILSPIAIVAYILPGTQKVWKLWWDTFSRGLLMFPIIEGFIAMGHAFAVVSYVDDKSLLAQMVTFVAYFGPYFALPMAFKLAGGAIGNISGMVNDRSRGILDRSRKYREGQVTKNTAKLWAGERFQGKSYIPGSRRLASRLNATTSRAGVKNFGFGRIGQESLKQKHALAAAEFAKSAAGQASQNNDGLLRAQTYANEIEARAGLTRDFRMNAADVDTAVAAAKANNGFGAVRQRYAAQQLGRSSTGYEDLTQVAQTIARVSANQSERHGLAGQINYDTKAANRHDLAPGVGQLSGLADAAANGNLTGAMLAEAATAAAGNFDAVTILRSSPQEVVNITQALTQRLGNQWAEANNAALPQAQRDAAMDQVLQTGAQISQLNAAKGYASPANQQTVNAMLHQTAAIRAAMGPMVTPEIVDPRTGAVTTPAGPYSGRWEELAARPPDPRNPLLP